LRFKKAVSRVIGIFVFLVFCAGMFVFINVIITKGREVPSFFGYSFLNVSTGSMADVYPVGTVVITKKTDIDDLQPCDVISFYSEDPAIKGIPNTHRIESIGTDANGRKYIITKGDSNDVQDSYPVYEDALIGKVRGSIKFAGKILNVISNRYFFFLFLIIPLAVMIVFEAGNIKKLAKKEEGNPETDETETKSPDIPGLPGQDHSEPPPE
jgi:signal peptidase I